MNPSQYIQHFDEKSIWQLASQIYKIQSSAKNYITLKTTQYGNEIYIIMWFGKVIFYPVFIITTGLTEYWNSSSPGSFNHFRYRNSSICFITYNFLHSYRHFLTLLIVFTLSLIFLLTMLDNHVVLLCRLLFYSLETMVLRKAINITYEITVAVQFLFCFT